MKCKNLLHDILINDREAIDYLIRHEEIFSVYDFYDSLENRDTNDKDLQHITEANIKDVYTEFCDLFKEDVDNDKKLLMFQTAIILSDNYLVNFEAGIMLPVYETYIDERGCTCYKGDRYYQIDAPAFLKFVARYSNPNMTEEQKGEFKDLCSRFLK